MLSEVARTAEAAIAMMNIVGRCSMIVMSRRSDGSLSACEV